MVFRAQKDDLLREFIGRRNVSPGLVDIELLQYFSDGFHREDVHAEQYLVTRSEPAWVSRRLLTLETRMEHEQEAHIEAVSA
jgi:hypothetical protein